MDIRKLLLIGLGIIFTGLFLLKPVGTASATPWVSDGPISTPIPSKDDPSSSDKKFDKKDIPRALNYMSANEKHHLAPVKKEGFQTTSSAPVSSYIVQPILFIATDLAETPGNKSAIDDTFQMLTRWYSGALELNNNGYRFNPVPTIVYSAPQPFSYYKCLNHEPDCDDYEGIWGNVQTTLNDANYPLWTPGFIHIVFVKGAGGWAGSNMIGENNWPAPGPASEGGFGILGDWALDSITGTTNAECFAIYGTACYRDPQRGAVGHELGHAFGLYHAMEQRGSIMYSWWDFPTTSLMDVPGNDEKSVLRNGSKFFLAQACQLDALVNQVNAPASVVAKKNFNVSIQVTNYGFCRWSSTTTTLNLATANVGGVSVARLDRYIYPAQSYTFSFLLTAPTLNKGSTSTSVVLIWQMQNSKKVFGPKISRSILVTR